MPLRYMPMQRVWDRRMPRPYLGSDAGTVDLSDWHDVNHSLQGSDLSDAGTWEVETLVADEEEPGRDNSRIGTVWKDNKLLILGADGNPQCIHGCGEPITAVSAKNFLGPEVQRRLLGNSCCTAFWLSTHFPEMYDEFGWNCRGGHTHGGQCLQKRKARIASQPGPEGLYEYLELMDR